MSAPAELVLSSIVTNYTDRGHIICIYSENNLDDNKREHMLFIFYESHFYGIWSRPYVYKLAGRLRPDVWQH